MPGQRPARPAPSPAPRGGSRRRAKLHQRAAHMWEIERRLPPAVPSLAKARLETVLYSAHLSMALVGSKHQAPQDACQWKNGIHDRRLSCPISIGLPATCFPRLCDYVSRYVTIAGPLTGLCTPYSFCGFPRPEVSSAEISIGRLVKTLSEVRSAGRLTALSGCSGQYLQINTAGSGLECSTPASPASAIVLPNLRRFNTYLCVVFVKVQDPWVTAGKATPTA